nr:winged helix-turn-helix transcriptional regulator [Candidatus Sigynarchaeota archaeon]
MSGGNETKKDPETKQPASSSFSKDVLNFSPSALQQKIIDIANEIMDQHYLFDSEVLDVKCIRMIKDASPPEIRAAIAELLHKRILVDGKSLTRLNVLENDFRNKIFDLVTRKPGLNVSKIAKEIGIAITTAKWHLKMLEQFQCIRSEAIDDNVYYFNLFLDKAHDRMHVMLNKKNAVTIVKQVITTPNITVNQLQTSLGIPRTTLLRKLKELTASKILVLDLAAGNDPRLMFPSGMESLLAPRLKEN